MSEQVRGGSSLNCWICEAPALDNEGTALEPLEPNPALQRVAHTRCLPLAELARRSVFRAGDASRLGPNRVLVLHVRTGGTGGARGLLLCKNTSSLMRRLGAVRDFGGVDGFPARQDACAVCSREFAAQVEHTRDRAARIREHARHVSEVVPSAAS